MFDPFYDWNYGGKIAALIKLIVQTGSSLILATPVSYLYGIL